MIALPGIDSAIRCITYFSNVLSGFIAPGVVDILMPSGIQGGAQQTATIDARVLQMMTGVMAMPTASCATTPGPGTYCSTRLSYATFGAVGPEPFEDTNGNNQRDPGECYRDINGNGSWDAEPGTTGQGGANDVVLYTMKVTYPRLFPLYGMLGWSGNQSIAASTARFNGPTRNPLQSGVATPITPPGLSTRNISASATSGRGANMCPNWLRTTSNEASA